MYYTSLFFSYSGQPEKMCVVSIMQKGGLAHTLEVKPLPSYMPHLHFIGGTRKVKKSALLTPKFYGFYGDHFGKKP